MIAHKLSVAIPTFRREQVLLDTLLHLLDLEVKPDELLVLDQTQKHTPAVQSALEQMHNAGQIRRLCLPTPCIPCAMNRGLLEAAHGIVVFVDDDIVPDPGFLGAHAEAHAATGAAIVAGRIIQPWEEGAGFTARSTFHFASLRPAWIDQFMGGNFSIDRRVALQLGGFDENFVRVAYNFEAEFAYRYRRSGRRIYYEPAACIHHLKVPSGGTRTYGEHFKTMQPDHAVGAYYYILRTWEGWRSLAALLRRPLRSVATRHHARQPWWIPLTLVGEVRGLIWALALAIRGPAFVQHPGSSNRGVS